MRKKLLAILITLFFSGGMAGADTVQLDLSDLGMPTNFSPSQNLYWQKNFDLGVTFSEISHVYINWSGQITAGLAVNPAIPGPQPFPLDVGVYASLGLNPGLRRTEVWGGESSYPLPESFNSQNEFLIDELTSWSDLLDGTGKITLGYTEYIILDGGYVESGSIALDSATLVVEGTVVPEPTSILLLAMGALAFRTKYLT